MGAIKAMAKPRTGSRAREFKDKNHEPRFRTLHDRDYVDIFREMEQARNSMLPGQTHQDFRCPICGDLRRLRNGICDTPGRKFRKSMRCNVCEWLFRVLGIGGALS